MSLDYRCQHSMLVDTSEELKHVVAKWKYRGRAAPPWCKRELEME